MVPPVQASDPEPALWPRRGTVSERALLMLRGYGLRSLRSRRGA